jgi:DNA polymerase-3 subunit beta
MKFMIHGGILSRSLQSISGVVPSGKALPILLNYHLKLNETDLTITASDSETTISVKLHLENVDANGLTEVTIPAKIFSEIVNSLSNQQLIIDIKEDFSIEIKADAGVYNLVGESAEVYPKEITLENAEKSVFSSSVMSKAISKTIFATDATGIRPQMSGVLCEQSEEGTIFVATDAHKLVKYRRPDCKHDEAKSFILPRKTLSFLNKLLASKTEDVDVVWYNNVNNIKFEFDNYTVISRLIDGKYPNYNMAIPKNNPNKLIIDRNMLYESVKRVSFFANPATNQEVFKLSENTLILSAQDSDLSTNATEKLSCNYDGEEMEIGFNANFLLEMLNNVDSELVIIELSSPDRAGIILPYEEEAKESEENILMFVMPVMLIN